jgi:predicted pyridoxine 5'-phosphate oxidase superfamily flavin-nucleotide-binding protein
MAQEKESRALRLLQYNQQREQAALEYQMKAAGLKVRAAAAVVIASVIGCCSDGQICWRSFYSWYPQLMPPLQDGPSRAERMKQRQVTRCIPVMTSQSWSATLCAQMRLIPVFNQPWDMM